ncbi:MAG TPA: FHA domain-containing serine/threonine-protein kinase, partial [Gemmataceae bacterium]|nr:FHA domain-containing serine/threonine-protein kinase [Gemmataceae bacterium]
MPLRLNVVDGGDRGQSFRLPAAGKVRIGNYGGHTDICLHDLYVAKDHCHVEIAGDGKVVVTAQPSASGTLVNGAKVATHELKPGDVLRVGNSYLKLEEAAEDTVPEVDVSDPAPTDPQAPVVPGVLPHLPPDRLRELVGHTLCHYTVGGAMAPGPVGTVFRAKDTKTDQDVALKVLPPDFPADDAEVQRFVRIMKQFLPLHHAGLVQLRGVGKTGPYVWVASDLVAGDSLAVAVKDPRSKQKGKWRPALGLARHLARILDFLQRKHLVHGAVSPANILLPAGGESPPMLKDAGLWDALAGSGLLRHAVGKRLLAELPYLSPEHMDPERPVDDLSDQYCFGAVVYAILTGRPPCEGETPEETVYKVETTRPLRPREACPGLPDAFQAVVLRTLAKPPEERYPGWGPLVA